jgi:hypothetical protein
MPPTTARWSTRGAALFGLLLALGCKRESDAAPRPEPSSRARFQRGQVVVVEQTAALFQETRVLEVSGERLRVDAADGGESVWVAAADVYALGENAALAAGAHAICGARGQWLPCRVKERGAERVLALDSEGRTLELRPTQLIAPRPVTDLNLKRHFQRALERRAFLDAYARAGKPRKPQGWYPGPRARVLAARDGQWFSAQIFEFDEEVPRVSFAFDGRVTEVPVSEIAPEPPYDLKPLARGDFVLLRPGGPAQAWTPALVRSLGDQELRVADVTGELRSVSARDVVPLSADR